MVEFTVSPHIPTPQGLNSPTFKPPPLNGSLTVPEILDYHAEHSPEHPLFVFANEGGQTRTICYLEARRMVIRAMAIVQDHYQKLESRYTAQEGLRHADQPPTIGILASAGLCCLVGIAGHLLPNRLLLDDI
jgi:hypothetical protein